MNEQSDDYDEVLKDMITVFQNRQKSDQLYFEKKYFDYLPNEILDSDDSTSFQNEEFNSESINLLNKGGNPSFDVDEEINADGRNRRTKRDVKNLEATAGRNKRQIWYNVPLYHHNPVPNIHFYYPIDLFSDISQPLPAYQSSRSSYNNPNPLPVFQPPRSYNNNPWTPQNNPSLRFYPPGNYYLPPPSTQSPPPTYLPPSPTNRPPIK